MQKFGIFELLDALSALTSREEGGPEPASAPSAPPSGENEGPPHAANTDAVAAFLARHEALVRSIDKKK